MKKGIAIAVLIIIAALIFEASAWLQGTFDVAISALEEYAPGNLIAIAALFVAYSVIATSVLIPLSSTPAIPFMLAILCEWGVFALLLLSWILGAIVSYFIGKYALFRFLKHLVPFEKIEIYRNKLYGRSEFIIVLLFRLAFPSEIAGYVLGILRYNFVRYLLITILAEMPFALAAVYAAEAFVGRNPMVVSLWLVFAGLIIVASFVILRRKLNDGGTPPAGS